MTRSRATISDCRGSTAGSASTNVEAPLGAIRAGLEKDPVMSIGVIDKGFP